MIIARKNLILLFFIGLQLIILLPRLAYSTYIKGKIVNQYSVPINEVGIYLYYLKPDIMELASTLPIAQGISGIGKDKDGNMLLPGEFYIFQTVTGQALDTTQRYLIQVLPISAAVVQDPAKGYIVHYYKDAFTIEDASPITISALSGKNLGNIILTKKGASIEGVVNLEGNTSPEKIRIPLFLENGTPEQYHIGTVDSNGKFRIGGLGSGNYYVKTDTSANGGPNDYVSMYYTEDGQGSLYWNKATLISLNAYEDGSGTPQTISSIEFNLKKGAKIRGQIKNSYGSPIEDTILSLTLQNTSIVEPLDVMRIVMLPEYSNISQDIKDMYPSIRSSANGLYEIKGVPYSTNGEFSYYLSVIEQLAPPADPLAEPAGFKYSATPLFYNDDNKGTIFSKDATEIIPLKAVENGEYICDFALPLGCTISGEISLADPVDMTNVPILVYARMIEGDNILPITIQGTILGEGAYSLSGLPKGSYIIGADTYVTDVSKKKHTSAFYQNANQYNANKVTLLSNGGKIEGRDFTLPLGGILKGKVVDAITNAGIEGVTVSLYKPNMLNPIKSIIPATQYASNIESSTTTKADGSYTLRGIQAGSYYLAFTSLLTDSDLFYQGVFYDGTFEGCKLANKGKLVVMKKRSSFNATNYIYCELGQSLANVGLSKVSLAQDERTICGLIALETGEKINISDFSLLLYKRGENNPSDLSARVSLYDSSIHQNIAFSPPGLNKDKDNTIYYSFFNVPDGEYKLGVKYVKYNLEPHYPLSTSSYLDTSDPDSCKVISIPLSTNTTYTNILISDYIGSISGHVSCNGDAPEGIIIRVSKSAKAWNNIDTWTNVANEFCDSSGNYNISGLSEGTYVVQVNDFNINRYLKQYYSSATSPVTDIENAEEIVLTSQNLTITGVDFDLDYGGKIEGRVIYADGSICKGGNILLFNSDYKLSYLSYPVKQISANTQTGGFTLSGVNAGNYYIKITDNLGNLLGYYTDTQYSTDPAKAKIISVGLNGIKNLGNIEVSKGTYEINGNAFFINDEFGDFKWPFSLGTLSVYEDIDGSGALKLMSNTLANDFGEFILKGLYNKNYYLVALDTGISADSVGNFESIEFSSSDNNIAITIPAGNRERESSILHLKKGLNLIGYPSIAISGQNSFDLIDTIRTVNSVRSNMTIGGFDNQNKLWAISSSDILYNPIKGSPFPIYNGKGYFLYSDKDIDVSFNYFKGQRELSLAIGNNLVANILCDDLENGTSRDILKNIGDENIESIHNYDSIKGEWRSNYWLWDKAAGNNEQEVDDSIGYIIQMQKEIDNFSL